MARFRRRRGRSRGGFSRRSRRSGGYGGGSSMMPILLAGGYGAVRTKAAQLVSPVTNMIPLGGIADEVALLGAAELLKRTVVKGGIVRQFLNGAQLIEAASIGQAIALGQVSMQPGTSSNNNLWSGGN